jgi:microcystin-dependent protein
LLTPFLGQIQLFAFGYAPMGYQLCDGALLSVESNQALFSLIGNKFGGNGSTTFALPKLNGSRPLNVDSDCMCYYIATQGIYPTRD